MDIDSICNELRKGSNVLALHSSNQKNHALECVMSSIINNKAEILEANARDVKDARENGMSEALVERLALDEKKFQSILDSIKIVIAQKDPIGEEVAGWKVPNGMSIRQVRFPLGVVAIIYESRPNVTVDAFTLAYKSGNSILLRGSSNALNSNKAITLAIKEGLESAGSDGVSNAIYLCEEGEHSEVQQILDATGKIDVVLPRGSSKLINLVTQNAKVPVIQTGAGVCHLYVDENSDLNMAARIAGNAKIQRPGACNAIETILVHKNEAEKFLPLLVKEFNNRVKIKACEKSFPVLEALCPGEIKSELLEKATAEDFGFEFLDFVVAVKVIEDLDSAIEFINSHNTKHSEIIVTNNLSNAKKFQVSVDAACVYVNASSRFTDGGEFGFGAELGISTQKLHARGPMGVQALTTTKYLIDGEGQIR